MGTRSGLAGQQRPVQQRPEAHDIDRHDMEHVFITEREQEGSWRSRILDNMEVKDT
jgi:hypothetical protein